MSDTYRSKLKEYSQNLRKNMTKEERHLWYDFLKLLPQTVNRQKVIGRYIVDFYCAEAKLVIELDGSQHYSEEGRQNDLERDSYFASQSLTVLRYTNLDIKQNFDGVCADILRHLDTSSVTAAPCHLPLKGKANQQLTQKKVEDHL